MELARGHLVAGETWPAHCLFCVSRKGRSCPRGFLPWKHDSLALQFPETALSHPGTGGRGTNFSCLSLLVGSSCVPVWTLQPQLSDLSHWVPRALTLILVPSHWSLHTHLSPFTRCSLLYPLWALLSPAPSSGPWTGAFCCPHADLFSNQLSPVPPRILHCLSGVLFLSARVAFRQGWWGSALWA